ncbi:hypothetical protein M8494_36310 [Serratia ureilytica]
MSDPDQGCGGSIIRRIVPFRSKLRRPPEPGTLTGEQKRGEKKIKRATDMFPEGRSA